MAKQIVLVIDDIGKEMLAAYDSARSGMGTFGNAYAAAFPYPATPNIDALAANGITYSNFRIESVCSEARAALLTGLYPDQNGTGAIVSSNRISATYTDSGNQSTPSLDPIAKKIGRKTSTRRGAFGKWHLYLRSASAKFPQPGQNDESGSGYAHPVNVYGFEIHQGPPHNLRSPDGTPGYFDYIWSDTQAGDQEHITDEHVTKKTLEAASAWVNSAGDDYFCWVGLTAAHGPFEWPPNVEGGVTRHNFGALPPDGVTAEVGGLTHFHTRIRALMEHLDSYIGEFFTAIGFDPTSPQADDPVVYILGDNGTDGVWGTAVYNRDPRGPILIGDDTAGNIIERMYTGGHPGWASPAGAGWGSWTGTDSDPLHEAIAPHDPFNAKATVYEEGINCPLIVGGNSTLVTRSNVIDDGLIDEVDLYATWMEVEGITDERPPQHSFSIVPSFTAADTITRDWSYSVTFRPNGLNVEREIFLSAFVHRVGGDLWKRVYRMAAGVEEEEFYNVSADAAVAPTGSIKILENPVAFDSIDIIDGITEYTFEFQNPGVTAEGAEVQVSFSDVPDEDSVLLLNDGPAADVNNPAQDIAFVFKTTPGADTAFVFQVARGASATDAATNLEAKLASTSLAMTVARDAASLVFTTTATGTAATATGSDDSGLGTGATGSLLFVGLPATASTLTIDDGVNTPIVYEYQPGGGAASGTNVAFTGASIGVATISLNQQIIAQRVAGNSLVDSTIAGPDAATDGLAFSNPTRATASNVALVESTTPALNATLAGMSGATAPQNLNATVIPDRSQGDPASVGVDEVAVEPSPAVTLGATITETRDNFIAAINALGDLDITATPDGGDPNKLDLVNTIATSNSQYTLGNRPISPAITQAFKYEVVGMSGGMLGERFERPPVPEVLDPNDLSALTAVSGSTQDAYNALLAKQAEVFATGARDDATPRVAVQAGGIVTFQVS